MNTLIEAILEQSGDMPDVAAHRRYLSTLSEAELNSRLSSLQRAPEKAPTINFWRRAVEIENPRQATLPLIH